MPPIQEYNRGLEKSLKSVKGLTGIEVLNGSTSQAANKMAFEYCTELQLMPIGASDAYDLEQVGKYAAWLPNMVYNLNEFIAEIKRGISKPAMLGDNGYTLLDFLE